MKISLINREYAKNSADVVTKKSFIFKLSTKIQNMLTYYNKQYVIMFYN